MKLIIIIANKAYEKDIQGILKNSEVNVFSKNDIDGFRFNGAKSLSDNWFGGGKGGENSILFFAFLDKDKIKLVFESIKEFNTTVDSSKAHAFCLNVENAI